MSFFTRRNVFFQRRRRLRLERFLFLPKRRVRSPLNETLFASYLDEKGFQRRQPDRFAKLQARKRLVFSLLLFGLSLGLIFVVAESAKALALF